MMNDAAMARARKMVAAKPDPRVQAIRCMVCRRLRSNPRSDDPRTWHCACGGIDFVETVPHDDELLIAVKLYSREIEENNTYSLMSRELIREVGS